MIPRELPGIRLVVVVVGRDNVSGPCVLIFLVIRSRGGGGRKQTWVEGRESLRDCSLDKTPACLLHTCAVTRKNKQIDK